MVINRCRHTRGEAALKSEISLKNQSKIAAQRALGPSAQHEGRMRAIPSFHVIPAVYEGRKYVSQQAATGHPVAGLPESVKSGRADRKVGHFARCALNIPARNNFGMSTKDQ
jgi:hypothetical protein